MAQGGSKESQAFREGKFQPRENQGPDTETRVQYPAYYSQGASRKTELRIWSEPEWCQGENRDVNSVVRGKAEPKPGE